MLLLRESSKWSTSARTSRAHMVKASSGVRVERCVWLECVVRAVCARLHLVSCVCGSKARMLCGPMSVRVCKLGGSSVVFSEIEDSSGW